MSMNSFHGRDKRPSVVHAEKSAPTREPGLTRADTLLVEQELAPSRAQARKLIDADRVSAGGARVKRASQMLPYSIRLEIVPCGNNEDHCPSGS